MSDVRLENVSKRFRDVTALDNVSLSIKDGEFFVLLGPNGRGKDYNSAGDRGAGKARRRARLF